MSGPGFGCGAKAHTQLSFWYRGAIAAGQALTLYVDDVLYQTYGNSSNYAWQQIQVTVASGAHVYRWDAAVTTAGQPGFWLDNIQCQ